MSETVSTSSSTTLDALVLGGGFGGMHMLYTLREKGLKVLALEAGADVGGAWYWNRYPGARCDVESLVYCYSFSPIIDAEWRWSEKYAAQPEISRYMRFVCDRLDLRKDIHFNSRLVKAVFDKASNLWTLTTENGDTYRARHFVSSAGPISAPIWPNIPGRESFRGEIYHSALWPHEEPVYTGKRVGIIGTGSSGTQIIPLVAQQAKQLNVFVRTPNLHVPARNRPLTDEDYSAWEKIKVETRQKLRTFEIVGSGDVFMDEDLFEIRHHPGGDFTPEQRREILERRWQHGGATIPRAFADVLTNADINEEVSNFLRNKVSEAIKDPELAKILTPTDIAYGTKRITVGTNYLETFNRDNVNAFDVKANPIQRFTEKGLIVGDEEIELDMIICASGFDALTGALTVIDIQGIGGKTIKEAWSAGSPTYLGLGVAGFPNLYLIGGPGSPSVLTNVVVPNEYQVEWISALIEYMKTNGYERVEASAEAQQEWTQKVQDCIKGTILEKSKSWYVGDNVPGKAHSILAYAGGLDKYISKLDKVAANGYEGFNFSQAKK
ncbi:MAG: NAD(P)/FAD-dependent oxidoreductase [Porticoccaceae bacterium]|nr:NAD(P)/FAD-dependent oxidoreductase [Porticoccaceae bacterium]